MNRIEKLQAKIHQQEARAAAKATAKPTKVKSRFAPPEPQPLDFNPPITLKAAIQSLSPAEAASPKIVAATIALQLLTQLSESPRPSLSTLSDNALSDLAWITSQVWNEKPDLRRVLSHATTIADSIEFRTLGEEGSGIRSLHAVEKLLVEQKMRGERK